MQSLMSVGEKTLNAILAHDHIDVSHEKNQDAIVAMSISSASGSNRAGKGGRSPQSQRGPLRFGPYLPPNLEIKRGLPAPFLDVSFHLSDDFASLDLLTVTGDAIFTNAEDQIFRK